MRPPDKELAKQLEAKLVLFDQQIRPLLGIRHSETRIAFVEQLLESIRRVKFVSIISSRKLSEGNADPNNELFDPLKAAIIHQRKGNIDEAFWLIFLFVHFGRHARAGWRYVREIYGCLGNSLKWNWESTIDDVQGFREWLDKHQNELKRKDVPHGFGNHRKYQSLDAYSPTGTGSAIESYIRWVNPPRTHKELFDQAYSEAGEDPRLAFDNLYHSMTTVISFGRLAKFDYLTMIGKMGLAPIEPGSVYLTTSTGPLKGAKLLFEDNGNAPISSRYLDECLAKLDEQLNVGMQVLEDALCNWQKSPNRFRPFRG